MKHNDIDRDIAILKHIDYVPLVWGDGSVTFNVPDGNTMKTLPFWSEGDVYDLFWELPESERRWLSKNAMKQFGAFDNGTPLTGYDHMAVIQRWLDWKMGKLPLNVRINPKTGKQEVW
jgi:hypothetical protein